MFSYVVRRLFWAIPVLLGVLLAVFVGLHVLPGNVAQSIGGPRATHAQIVLITKQLGLNRPIYDQFWIYFTQMIRGQLGNSLQYHTSVVYNLEQAFPITVEISAVAFLIAAILGVLAGTLAAVYRNSWFDNVLMILVLIGVSMPIFWTGIMLILLLGVDYPIFPFTGVITAGASVAHITGMPLVDALLTANWAMVKDSFMHIVLPSITLATYPISFIVRMTRGAMIDVMSSDFLRTARAKGLKESIVVFKHGLRNASLPIVTVLGVQIGSLLSGAVLTETVYSIPGMGRLTIQAILFRDYPLVQGIVIVAALVFVLANIVVDLMYAVLDPRIRYS